MALESARNLHLPEQHRRRAESLMGLALELNSQLRLPEFARNFVTRAADLLGPKAGALALQQDSVLEMSAAALPTAAHQRSSVLHRFEHAMTRAWPSIPRRLFP